VTAVYLSFFVFLCRLDYTGEDAGGKSRYCTAVQR